MCARNRRRDDGLEEILDRLGDHDISDITILNVYEAATNTRRLTRDTRDNKFRARDSLMDDEERRKIRSDLNPRQYGRRGAFRHRSFLEIYQSARLRFSKCAFSMYRNSEEIERKGISRGEGTV
jgi:hypothetical protein